MSDPRHHLAFPFRVGGDGRAAAPTSLEEHVEQELIQLLLTDLGERLFMRDFGTTLRRMVFQGNDPASAGVVKATVTQALGRWLNDRLVVDDLQVEAVGESVDVMLRYRVVGGDDASRVLRLRRPGR
jgi:phage baseplate assembly protein W